MEVVMKSKLLFFDLAICALWMLSMFGGRGSWAYTAFPFIVLEVLYRLVISFSLAHKEKRAWLPLLIFVPLIAMSVVVGVYNGVGEIIYRIFDLTKLEYSVALKYALGGFLMLWLFVLPYVYYGTKHSLSYALNIPDSTMARYRIYVRLATDSIPADSTLIELAEKVATLRELKLPAKTKGKENMQ